MDPFFIWEEKLEDQAGAGSPRRRRLRAQCPSDCSAQHCSVRVAVEPATLRLEIADNGAGISIGSSGIGLHTMKERAAEVGGTCAIGERAGGGTLVLASLPRLPAAGTA